MRHFERLCGLSLAILVVVVGCDGSGGAPPASSSAEQVKVKGKVTHQGKPLAKVEVRYNPANVNRKTAPTASATTGEDGSYELTTLLGENVISLNSSVARKDVKLTTFNKAVDLKPGDNSGDLDVP
jgi:hypothetical protein